MLASGTWSSRMVLPSCPSVSSWGSCGGRMSLSLTMPGIAGESCPSLGSIDERVPSGGSCPLPIGGLSIVTFVAVALASTFVSSCGVTGSVGRSVSDAPVGLVSPIGASFCWKPLPGVFGRLPSGVRDESSEAPSDCPVALMPSSLDTMVTSPAVRVTVPPSMPS